MIAGTDLAYSNRKINYPAMKADGIQFAFIRIGQGLEISDNLYIIHKAGCKSIGIPWGPYFFADYSYPPVVQSTRFSLLVGEDIGELPWMFDFEYEERLGWGRPSGYAMYKWGCSFLENLEQKAPKGKKLETYTNPDLIHAMKPWLKPGDPFLRNGLFLAHWTTEQYIDFEPWSKWDFWQQAGDVHGDWSEGDVDYDYFNGTEAELCALCTFPPSCVPANDHELLIRLVGEAKAHGWKV